MVGKYFEMRLEEGVRESREEGEEREEEGSGAWGSITTGSARRSSSW